VNYPWRWSLEHFAGFTDRDWLRPDAVQGAAALKRRLARIARLPGLAALVLKDTAAPGYARVLRAGGTGQGFSGAAAAALANRGWDFGYTPEMRVRFLRVHRIDPLDLNTQDRLVNVELNPPFFPGLAGSANFFGIDAAARPATAADLPLDAWDVVRADANARLMADLFEAVRTANPDLPLLVRSRESVAATQPGGVAWYGSWDRAEAVPAAPAMWGQQTLGQVARAQSRRVWLAGPLGASGDLGTFLAYSSGYLQDKAGWDGLVLDASEMAEEKVRALLEAIASVHAPSTP
jgi:hypothetical protein